MVSASVQYLVIVFLSIWCVFYLQPAQSKKSLKDSLESAGFDCKKIMKRVGKEGFKVMTKCTKSLQEIDPEYDFEKKFDCVVKCTLDGFHMLNAEMKSDEQAFNTFLNASVPEHFQGHTKDLMWDCFEEFGPSLDPKDEYCKSYGKLFKCIQDRFSSFTKEVCEFEE